MPDLWVGEASQQATAYGTDLGASVSQGLNQGDLQEAIQHQGASGTIGKRFFTEHREERAQAGRLRFIAPYPDDGEHQGGDEIAIGGGEFKVSGYEPRDVGRLLG